MIERFAGESLGLRKITSNGFFGFGCRRAREEPVVEPVVEMTDTVSMAFQVALVLE